MKYKVAPVCIALCVLALAVPRAQRGAGGPVTAIVGAKLIDGTGSSPVDDSVVIVSGDRIIAAGPRARVKPPQGATVVDATGKTLIPGLEDTHYHLNQPPDEMKRMILDSLPWAVPTFPRTGQSKPNA